GGQGAEQQGIVDAVALPPGREGVEGIEGAQLVVEGEQLVERAGGHGGGHERTFAAPQPLQDGGLVVTEPLQRHDAPPRCAIAYGLDPLSPIVCPIWALFPNESRRE